MKKGCMLLLVLFAVVTYSGIASADLILIGTATYNDNEYNLIYEDNQGLIWMDYTLPANRWLQQTSNVSRLNDPGVLTYNFNPRMSVSWEGEWRLPKSVDGPRRFGFDGTTTAGFNIITSEMGQLFYNSLGNPGYYDKKGEARPGWGKPESQHEWGLKNTGPFVNLEPGGQYWSCTEYAIYPQRAWSFNMYWGSQSSHAFKGSYSYSGLAVRSAAVVER